MNVILSRIEELRKDRDFLIDTTNSNRHRIVFHEKDETKTAYYFSTPIYNISSKKLIDLKISNDSTPRLIGSNAQITFSNNVKMNNTNGNCFITLKEQPKRVSDYKLCEGENIIIPTTNGFVYKVPIKSGSNHSIDIKTDRAFFTTRSNNKYFALMLDKFTPFVYISAIGLEDSDGFIVSPFLITGSKISDYEYKICYSSEKKLGKYFVFEINMYERKMIQDTTVESAYPNENNAFGSTAFLGTTSEFGEQWLYSRVDYMCVNDIAGCRIKSAIAYIPKLGKNAIDIETYKVSERFCSFGSTWDNKKSESNYVSCSNASDKYVIVDITNALIHEKSKQLIATNGLIFKSKKKNFGFSAISTGDSCFMPQIIEINYF